MLPRGAPVVVGCVRGNATPAPADVAARCARTRHVRLRARGPACSRRGSTTSRTSNATVHFTQHGLIFVGGLLMGWALRDLRLTTLFNARR